MEQSQGAIMLEVMNKQLEQDPVTLPYGRSQIPVSGGIFTLLCSNGQLTITYSGNENLEETYLLLLDGQKKRISSGLYKQGKALLRAPKQRDGYILQVIEGRDRTMPKEKFNPFIDIAGKRLAVGHMVHALHNGEDYRVSEVDAPSQTVRVTFPWDLAGEHAFRVWNGMMLQLFDVWELEDICPPHLTSEEMKGE